MAYKKKKAPNLRLIPFDPLFDILTLPNALKM